MAACVAARASVSLASLKFTANARKELQVTAAPRTNSAVGQVTASDLNRNPAATAPASAPDVAPPAPGLAVRSPVLSLLLAGPLWLGADLTRLAILHVAWAGAVGGATLLLARRVTSLPAALGFSALVAWSFAWVLFAQQLLTEVTSVALLCAFLLAVRPALRSVPGATPPPRDDTARTRSGCATRFVCKPER